MGGRRGWRGEDEDGARRSVVACRQFWNHFPWSWRWTSNVTPLQKSCITCQTAPALRPRCSGTSLLTKPPSTLVISKGPVVNTHVVHHSPQPTTRLKSAANSSPTSDSPLINLCEPSSASVTDARCIGGLLSGVAQRRLQVRSARNA